MAPSAVLAGLLMIVSFAMSHSIVEVQNTDWAEPVLLWIAVCMPTGMGKSSLCKYLRKLVREAQKHRGLDTNESLWLSDDQSFEKMGDLMSQNHWKLLGLYDELPMFLSQVNIFRGRGLSDSHELAVFLQLYGAEQWVRKTVSGEANFSMSHTGLTVGGFMQPSVARNLIEVQANIEKGLCQRFLWLVPEPNTVAFADLQKVDTEFSASMAGLMSNLWVSDHTIRKWILTSPCKVFSEKYDKVQGQILEISCMDDLLSGMLSKSRGQILRVAATLHVLFNMDTPQNIPQEISDEALLSAKNFVEVCNQHVAFLAGRGVVSEAIEGLVKFQKGFSSGEAINDNLTHSNAAYSLLLPGKILILTTLNSLRKFRDRGNKAGAIEAWKQLQEKGLGKLVTTKAKRGTDMLHKQAIPEDSEKKIKFSELLLSYGVSLQQYKAALEMDSLSPVGTSRKRGSPFETPPRKSPRHTDEVNSIVSPNATSRKTLNL